MNRLSKLELAVLEDLKEKAKLNDIAEFVRLHTTYLSWFKAIRDKYDYEELNIINILLLIESSLLTEPRSATTGIIDINQKAINIINRAIYYNEINLKDYKYLVYGGKIKSKNDNDNHWVTPHQISKLYGISHLNPIYVDNDRIVRGLNLDEYITLEPRYDGDYDIYKRIKEQTVNLKDISNELNDKVSKIEFYNEARTGKTCINIEFKPDENDNVLKFMKEHGQNHIKSIPNWE